MKLYSGAGIHVYVLMMHGQVLKAYDSVCGQCTPLMGGVGSVPVASELALDFAMPLIKQGPNLTPGEISDLSKYTDKVVPSCKPSVCVCGIVSSSAPVNWPGRVQARMREFCTAAR